MEEVNPDLLIPNKTKSPRNGAIAMPDWSPKDSGGYSWQMVEALAKHAGFSVDEPISTLNKAQLDLLLYGTKGEEVRVEYIGRSGRRSTFSTPFEGVIGNMMRRYKDTDSEWIRAKIGAYISLNPCPECHGKRLRKEALGVTVDSKNIIQVTEWAVNITLNWVDHLMDEPNTPLSKRDMAIADRILREIKARLGFMVDVGLDYLTLERSAISLSGGEAQRIRLATQVGSKLMGVLYVLDEPSIGLHPRDNSRLLETLKGLRDPW